MKLGNSCKPYSKFCLFSRIFIYNFAVPNYTKTPGKYLANLKFLISLIMRQKFLQMSSFHFVVILDKIWNSFCETKHKR